MNAIEVNRTDIRCVCGKYDYFNQINVEGDPVNQLFCANCGLMMRSPGTDKNGEWLKEEWKKHVEPKRGRWVLEEETAWDYSEPIYRCSVCNNYEAWGKTECTKYCPNCGAKMEGGENND